MKAISITEPWATLVAIGAKRIETRSRNFVGSFRGPLAIHASKGFPKWAKEMCGEEPFFSALIHNELSPGCIVATCNLVDILPTEARGCLPGVFERYPNLAPGWTSRSRRRARWGFGNGRGDGPL